MAEFINFTTGPVKIERKVSDFFSSTPVSHRSTECKLVLDNLKTKLCNATQAKDLIIMNGSGTLANEAMIAQIARLKTKGLILSNGEFGERLIKQSKRYGILFSVFQKVWGYSFLLEDIESEIDAQNAKWVLVCHNETSTGVINDLKGISILCKRKGICLFVDCMSSIGNMELDLSAVHLATCSSGKGLASHPGLALVFSNLELEEDETIPQYLDLGYYKANQYMPFTISSNQLSALDCSTNYTMNPLHWKKNIELAGKMKGMLLGLDIELINKDVSNLAHVFTINIGRYNSVDFGNCLKGRNIHISYESQYLKTRNCIQIAIMGVHSESEVTDFITEFSEMLDR